MFRYKSRITPFFNTKNHKNIRRINLKNKNTGKNNNPGKLKKYTEKTFGEIRNIRESLKKYPGFFFTESSGYRFFLSVLFPLKRLLSVPLSSRPFQSISVFPKQRRFFRLYTLLKFIRYFPAFPYFTYKLSRFFEPSAPS